VDTDGDYIPDFRDTDSDNDGLSDAWEHEHGTDPTSSDSDGEGHTNLEEINANAQPGWCVSTAPGCDNNGFTAPSSAALLDPAAANQVPTANPGGPYSATVGTPVTLDGSGSTDPDGSIASYAWTFGDGSSGSGVRPSATYASAGNFTVTLTVTDDRGASSQPVTTTVTVNVGQQPPTASAGGPYSGTVNQQVAFDGTGSSDPDGSVVSYAWRFGDGNSGTGPTPTHSYATGGAFTVTLTVTDNDNLTGTSTTTASITDGSGVQPPVANAGGPYAGNTGIGIQMDGSGSADPDGTITAYAWDFGDGSRASVARPVHAYAAAGLYTVTLVVTDNAGQQGTASTTADVTDAPNRAPVANPGGPYSAEPGTPVSFDGSGSSDADGSVASYAWEFGDGNLGSGSAPTHAYAAAGTYTVTLTVTDDLGLDDHRSALVGGKDGCRHAVASGRGLGRRDRSGRTRRNAERNDLIGDAGAAGRHPGLHHRRFAGGNRGWGSRNAEGGSRGVLRGIQGALGTATEHEQGCG